MHDPYLEYVIYIGVFFWGRETNRKGLIKTVLLKCEKGVCVKKGS